MRQITVSTLVAFSLATIAAPAVAETESVRVARADLDLTTPEGLATLRGRIAGAIYRVCPPADHRNMRRKAARERCMSEAAASAEQQLARIAASRTLAVQRSGEVRN